MDAVIDATPSNGSLSETDQPNDKRHRIPQRNQRNPLPNARLLHAPDADQPRYCDSKREIDANVDKLNFRGRVDRDGNERPRQVPM